MKRVLFFLLALIVSFLANAEDFFYYTYQGTTLGYTVRHDIHTWASKSLEVTSVVAGGLYPPYDEHIVIPKSFIYDGEWNTVVSIGDDCFSYCSRLETIDIPNTVTRIGRKAFCNCQNLKDISIPNSVSELGSFAFMECSSLTDVSIPASVNKIGSSPFAGCQNLTQIIVDNDNPSYTSSEGILYDKDVTELICFPASLGEDLSSIPSTVSKIGTASFYGCNKLYNISIPTSISIIGSSAFEGCNGLLSIVLPSSLKMIEGCAFFDCSSLESIYLPNSLTFIDFSAFEKCTSLKSIYYNTDDPVEGRESIFSDYSTPTLYIPQSSLAISRFRLQSPWKLFDKIETFDFSGIEDVIVNDKSLPTEIYNLNGIKISNDEENLSNGVYIIRQGKNSRKQRVF